MSPCHVLTVYLDAPRKRGDLPKVLFRFLWWSLVVPMFPRIFLIAFTFCQPLLLKRLLNYLGSPDGKQALEIGYGLIGAYGIVYLGIAVSYISAFT
jgi:hypothetical protein